MSRTQLKPVIFGIYNNDLENITPDSSVKLCFQPLDFIAHWNRCSVTADFLSGFQNIAFTSKNSEKYFNILSTVINELLENSIKFSFDKTEPVFLQLNKYSDVLTAEAYNITASDGANNLNVLAKKIKTEYNLEDLYQQKLMRIKNTDFDISGLGLIMLLKDLHAELGIKILPKTDTSEPLYDIFIKILLRKEALDLL
jgi:hypothetical protein